MHEAKQVLDSWVRYEGQVKQRQQRELAETIIGKITKELENPKTLQQILEQRVADVESKLKLYLPNHTKVSHRDKLLIYTYRHCVFQGAIEHGCCLYYANVPLLYINRSPVQPQPRIP